MGWLTYRRGRYLLLGLCALTFTGLWFGLWARLLPLRPRLVISLPRDAGIVGFDHDGQAVITAEGKYEEWTFTSDAARL